MTTEPAGQRVRYEVLFEHRLVRCFESRPRSLWELFCQSAEADPSSEVLLWEPDGRLTYAQLAQQASALSRGLKHRGVAKGDRVAVLMSNRAEYVIVALATWRAGAVLVPLDTRLRMPEIERILCHSGAKLLICENALSGVVPPREKLPELAVLIRLDGPAPSHAEDFAACLEHAGEDECESVDEEDAAAILYTSGTTGEPKGVVLAHVNIVHSTMHFEEVWQLPKGSRSALAIPATNVTGLVTIILTFIRIGGCVVIMPPFRASTFLSLAAKWRINHTFMVPAQYKLCLMDANLEQYDLSAWHLGSTGGAPMPPAFIAELRNRIPTLQISDGYGATELASPALIRPANLTSAHPDSVGRAVTCADVIVMAENGTEAPVGEPGELWIKGPMVCRGYWRNPQADAEAFVDGFWKSGDIATMDSNGFVRLHDRKKDVINRGGYKIYSAEVESVLSQHPLVAEVAVIAKADSVLGERVHAVVFASKTGLDEATLKSFCEQHLADFKVPESYTFRDQPLPRNANGKVVKRALRDSIFPPQRSGE